MRHLLFVAAICMVAAPALASPELLPVKGTHYATYDMATGELTPTSGPTRYGDSCWAATYDTGWYFGSYANDWVVLDWGDCGDPATPYTINGFAFAYATEMIVPDRLTMVMWFFAEENGWNSYARVPLAGFAITDLPTGNPPSWNGWTVTIDLEDTGYEFDLDGSDLDADTLVDFGYTYWFQDVPAGDATGPHISGDPNELLRPPGAEDAFDAFFLDMADPNEGLPGAYDSTYWFGGDPFAQFYLELYEGNDGVGCPNPGGSGWFCTADIEYTNQCVVNLLDLATLLQYYGTTTGATHEMGDVEPEDGNGYWDPYDGDGDVDLADLARLLTQYGDDCN